MQFEMKRLRICYGIRTKVLDFGLKESKFIFKLCYDFHFWTNAHGKGMKAFIPLAMV